jgi:hypothetical protein
VSLTAAPRDGVSVALAEVVDKTTPLLWVEFPPFHFLVVDVGEKAGKRPQKRLAPVSMVGLPRAAARGAMVPQGLHWLEFVGAGFNPVSTSGT